MRIDECVKNTIVWRLVDAGRNRNSLAGNRTYMGAWLVCVGAIPVELAEGDMGASLVFQIVRRRPNIRWSCSVEVGTGGLPRRPGRGEKHSEKQVIHAILWHKCLLLLDFRILGAVVTYLLPGNVFANAADTSACPGPHFILTRSQQTSPCPTEQVGAETWFALNQFATTGNSRK